MKRCAVLLVSVLIVASLVMGCAPAAPAAPSAATEAPAPAATEAAQPAATEAAATEAPAPAATEAPAQPEASGEPTVLDIAMAVIPTNLDVVMNTADDAAQIASGPIFEQLVAMDNTYKPVPELATHWEMSDDAKHYTYYLRQGVKFHNGEEMKASDVVASMNRWIEAADNAKSLVGDDRFTEVDDYTVEIKLTNGSPYLNLMIGGLGQHAAIMPKSSIDKVDPSSQLLTEYIGTGPYKFDSWVENQYIKIVKYDEYQPYGTEGDYSGWAGYKKAKIDTIFFHFVVDPNTILTGMQTGEYDASDGITYDNYDVFANDENFYIVSAESEQPALIFNKKEGWGANQKFRQALAALVNIDDIMLAAHGNEDFYHLYSSYMFKSQTDWYTDRGSEYFNVQDKDKALELFAEAGFTPNDTFTILVSSDSEDFYAMAVVIKSQMEAIGMKCDLLVYDWSTFVTVRNNEPDKYDAFITSFSEKVLPNMNLFLSPSWAGWATDERIVADLATIGQSTDFAAAQQTWFDLQEYMLAESVPVIKFGNTVAWGVVSKNVPGMEYFNWMTFVDAEIVE